MGLASFAWPEGFSDRLAADLKPRLKDWGMAHGEVWIRIDGRDIRPVVEYLRDVDVFSFDALVDVCGVDYLGRAPRFESVVHLYSTKNKIRIRIHAEVPDESLTIPSLTAYWKGANWHEREAFDQYGIRYEGHPNLTRILNAPEETGHPQRKDYPLRGDREPEEDL